MLSAYPGNRKNQVSRSNAAFFVIYNQMQITMLKKQDVLSTVSQMPETFDADELFEKILLLKKIEEGRRQAREGQAISMEEAKEKPGAWLK